MIFFWPNFDVRKEQVSNTKREHGQTDARKPSKSIFTKNDPTRIQTRKASNRCTKSLKSDFPTRSRSQPLAEARRDTRGARPTQKQTAWLDRARHPQSSTKDQSSSRSQNSTRAQSSTRDQSSESSKLQEGRAPRKLRDPEDLRAGRELRDPREFSAPKQLRAPRNPRELRAPQEPKIDERVENGSMMTTMMRRQEDNDDIRTSNTR